jgi:hypothetical protein
VNSIASYAVAGGDDRQTRTRVDDVTSLWSTADPGSDLLAQEKEKEDRGCENESQIVGREQCPCIVNLKPGG